MNKDQLVSAIEDQVARFAEQLTSAGLWFACAESCTGGLLSKFCTDRAGSSSWFERAFISYSNAAKQQMLGVDPVLIQQHGAVSEQVARAMVVGVLENAPVQVAASVTGIAGPGGGSEEKPVGTVCFGFYTPSSDSGSGSGFQVETRCFAGDREMVRLQSVEHVFSVLLHQLKID
jgi:nicotinamide-nucleotide amidase